MKRDQMYELIGEQKYKIFYSWRSEIENLSVNNKLRKPDVTSVLFHIWHTTHGFISHRIKHPGLPWKSDDEEVNVLLDTLFYGIIK